MSGIARLGVSVLACFGAGLLGSLFIETSARSWYDILVKPAFTPPGWTIALIWLVLYVCMSLALWLVWEKDEHATEVTGWVPLFFAHLLVNAAWPMFFFGFHAILIALIDIFVLIACVIILMLGAWEVDRRATYLLAPYLLWVSFSTVLNISIWYLN
jgi:tryptophan-rich sensory protein